MLQTESHTQASANPQSPSADAREALLAIVRQSPALIAVHDRAGWLGLFTPGSAIEDPVGSPRVPKGDGTLDKFWDTFIGPNEIVFEVKRDHVVGRDVFRDVIIHTRVGGKIAVDVYAYLLYQVDDQGGVWRMAAHWDLARMSLGAMKLGPGAWVEMTKLFSRMIGTMGLGWVGGYLASLWNGIGGRGVRTAQRLAQSASAGDASAVADLFADADARVELGTAELTVRAFCERVAGGLRIEAPIAAGWTTSFRFFIDGSARAEGLALLEFDQVAKRIKRARFFPA